MIISIVPTKSFNRISTLWIRKKEKKYNRTLVYFNYFEEETRSIDSAAAAAAQILFWNSQ